MPGVVTIGGIGTAKLRLAMRNGAAVRGHKQQSVPDYEAEKVRLRRLAQRMNGRKGAPAQTVASDEAGEQT